MVEGDRRPAALNAASDLQTTYFKASMILDASELVSS